MAKCAIFTLQRDEFFHLPLWLAYYGQHFAPEDMYIFDHQSQLPDVRYILDHCPQHVTTIEHDQIYDHDWYVSVINRLQRQLLSEYEYVLYVDCDDWLIPARGSLYDFIASAHREVYRPVGYEVILDKMHKWGPEDKPCLTRIPLEWGLGCHTSIPDFVAMDDLFLYHLHRLEYEPAWKKRQLWQSYPNRGPYYQGEVGEVAYKEIFNTAREPLEPHHPRLTIALQEVYKILDKARN